MPTSKTWNGIVYAIPLTGEENWGGPTKVDGLLVALVDDGFQKTGGTFALSADVDFSSSFGLKSLYYKTRSANLSTTGNFRLANADTGIGWRNAANNADLLLTVNASNQLVYNSVVLSGSSALTASRAMVTDASGYASAATTTAVEIGYVNGVTSAIQTQLNLKSPIASPTFTGTATAPVFAGAFSLTVSQPAVGNGLANPSSADQVHFYTASTDRGSIDQNGKWTIGTAAGVQVHAVIGSLTVSVGITGNVTGNASGTAATFTGSLTGDVTSTGMATTIAASIVTGKLITGYVSGAGAITASDSLLTAINKLNGNALLLAPLASPTFTGTVTPPSGSLSATAWSYGASTFGGSGVATFTGQLIAKGTATNDSAAAGYIGEVLSATQTVNQANTNSTSLNLVSLALTAGDWDVWAIASWTGTGATSTLCIGAISTTNTGLGQVYDGTSMRLSNLVLGSQSSAVTVGPFPLKLTGTTTYYLNTRVDFTVGTVGSAGTLFARRRR